MRGCSLWLTGAGKSVIIAEIARMTTLKGNRILFLVHRKELIDQIRGTFIKNEVDLDYVHFGMVQTVVRNLEKMPKPDLIITDENHHALAKTYRTIYDYYHDVLKLGFTATPIRLNGSGLGDVNDLLIEEVDAKYLIKNGFLAPYKYYAPTLVDPFELKLNSMREFSNSSINNAIAADKKKIYGDVIKHYKQLADGEQAIAYCHSIESSIDTRNAFLDSGIKAQHIDAKTPKKERDEIIQAFRDKEIKILCNVDLIGEGLNVPDCSTVIMLRPTKSLSLYIHQSMRGMRYRPNKTSIIIDHVGNVHEHGLPDMSREWSLDGKKKNAMELTVKIKECMNCFAVYPAESDKCSECGFTPPVEERETEYEHDTDSELKELTEEDKQTIELNFKTPEECETVQDLYDYAKVNNFKPGWAYYQAKARGWM